MRDTQVGASASFLVDVMDVLIDRTYNMRPVGFTLTEYVTSMPSKISECRRRTDATSDCG